MSRDVDLLAWTRDANAQALSDVLNLDVWKDGYGTQEAWEQQPAPCFDEVAFQSAGPNSMQFNADFTFAEQARGACTFVVTNPPEQLAIDLGGRLSDTFGYVVILGDAGEPVGVISKMRGTRLTDVQDLRPRGWHFAQANNALWLIYDYGTMTVGSGCKPGEGQLLMRARDPTPFPGCDMFGFGAWKNPEHRYTTVHTIRSYRKRARQPHLYQQPYHSKLSAF